MPPKRKSSLSRTSKKVTGVKKLRENEEYKNSQKQRDTAAHQSRRQSADCKAAEQSRNTAAHQSRRQSADYRAAEQSRDTAARQTRRQSADYRATEQSRDTAARQTRRQSADCKAAEQSRNTAAHQQARKVQLQAALKKSRRIGVVFDVEFFKEADYPQKHQNHQLASLYDSGRKCSFCRALCWKEERPGFCCEKGKISLDILENYPDDIKPLFNRKEFVNKIRHFNNALAMASIGLNEDVLPGFSPVVKLQGKIHHLIGALQPVNDESHPTFAQIWFHDSDEVENRLRFNEEIRSNAAILSTLQNWLRQNNPYIQSMKSALEMMDGDNEITMVIDARKRPSGEHVRRYNLPQASEVSVIIPGEHVDHLNVILHQRDGKLQAITELHRSYDPLHYVLMFPSGAEGFKLDIPHTRGRGTVSPSEFARFRLQVRDEHFNQVMRCRRLTQQYACDQYAKAEASRLRWVRNNQKSIRAEKYQGLMDAIDNQEEMEAGTKIILPPSIYGSPRWYAEAFQDAMAIVRSLGKPDVFVTFTCNPQWPEIRDSLLPGEQPHDRPDLTARVFNIKLKALMGDLKSGMLGRVVSYFAMKEDQKRGLPHCHILLIVADEDKPRQPKDVDRIVSAELPDPKVNPKLYEIITRNNIHGPCGVLNQQSPCMARQGGNFYCEKDFPQRHIENTVLTASTYPLYRRRSPDQGGQTHTMKVRGHDVEVTNEWVVPYNPLLSLKYNAHINVHVVTAMGVVKYVYKYFTKGGDRVIIKLANGEERDITDDEVACFVDARYISASAAYWRLYEFPIQLMKPSVQKLPIHLEDEQIVLFQPEDLPGIANRGPPKTKLTEFFKINQSSDVKVIYPDMFKHFRWVRNTWQKRTRVSKLDRGDEDGDDACSDMIGRIPVINLSKKQSELFYMRMLLHIVVGPTSFKDLRTYDGVEHSTYQAACLARGLLDDESEIDRSMEEAASVRFGSALREVFAFILIFVQPTNPVAFWERHKRTLMEDLLHKHNLQEPTEAAIHTTLLEIQIVLQRHGLDLEKDFQLPKADPAIAEQLETVRIIEDETNYDVSDLQQYVSENVPKLNDEQRVIYDAVIKSVTNDSGQLFSLDAPGGTGKTFLICVLLAQLRSEKKIALATAMSGIAATLLPNGRTLHSRCKVPISITEDSTCSITKRDSTGQLIKQCHLLIIDEVSMCHRHIFEALNRTFCDIREDDRLFGGITMILSGDWRQILPVVRKGGRAETVAATLKQSPLWKHVTVHRLTRNMRVHNSGNGDETFANELLKVGEGRLPIEQEIGQYKVQVKEDYLIQGPNVKSLIDVIFADLSNRHDDSEWLCSRTILCPTNEAVDEVNQIVLRQFPGEETVYLSNDKLLDTENSFQYPVEFLNTICVSGMPPHKLCLKKGSPIMLLRNFDPKNGHCNGSRYIVDRLMRHVIYATLATGSHAGKKLFIPRIPIVPSDNLFPFQMQRKQFPVRPCFAMTSNKAQGQTLDKVGIYLKTDFFSHGQLYVAMSRVGNGENIRIYAKNLEERKGTFINNVVYPEILR